MMRGLYQLLLLLYPPRIRADFGEEMLAVHDEAAAEARARGSMTYLRFCLRETAGLLGGLLGLRYGRAIAFGATAGMIFGLAVGLVWQARPYTSVAVIRLAPSQIPERLVPSSDSDAQRMLPEILQTVLSRGNVKNIIETQNLYVTDRKRQSLEKIAARMREDIQWKPIQNGAVEITFSYSDPERAREVAAALVSRILAACVQMQTVRAVLAAQFLKEQSAEAGEEWERRLEAVRAARNSGRASERLRLDAEIARQHYEQLSAKLAESRVIESLYKRQQGPLFEVLDPASLPSDDRPGVLACALAGAAAGALIGFLIGLLLEVRTTRTAEA